MDQQAARKCKGCGRHFLVVVDRGDAPQWCRICERTNRRTGGAYVRDGRMLEDVRAGTWRPTPELAAMLAHAGEEISECPGCGKVRRRPIGQWCGGTGCEAQARMAWA